MTQPTHVPVAGLLVPVQLVPRIIKAFRGTYPALTDGLSDEAAVRAVLKYWVTGALARYESTIPALEAEAEIDSIRARVADASEEARKKAEADAGTIADAAVPPTAPVVIE